MIGNWIADILDAIKDGSDLTIIEKEILQKVHQMTNQFPIY